MSELRFSILTVRGEPYAAVPTLNFRTSVSAGAEHIKIASIALACQIRIEPNRRRYERGEELSLEELFGIATRWGETLRPFLWTHVGIQVPTFTGSGEFDLPVPCSYDFEVTAAKYLHALEGGEIPLLFLFSGTVFGEDERGLRVTQVPWTCEARFRLPVSEWRGLMDRYFPNGGWLRLDRNTIDALMREKARRAVPRFDDVIQALLAESGVDGENGENAA